MPNSSLADGLLADLVRQLNDRATAYGYGGQTKLANEAGIERTHFLKILKGHLTIDVATMVEIARNLDLVIEHDGFIVGPVMEPSRRTRE